VAEKKLITRNERIQNLEALLKDAQTRLEIQNQKFEAQLSSMREKLQEARTNTVDSSWLHSGRIAKPLRGGARTAVAITDEEEEDSDRGKLCITT
jgi:kinesin family protein 5